MSNRDDNHEDEEYYEDDSSSPVRSIFTLLVIGGFACYAAVTLPFGQKIVGPMDIPVISDMVHDKIGERLLKYTVDEQKFVNECGGSVATTTPYTFVSKPSAMPDGVSLVHIVI